MLANHRRTISTIKRLTFRSLHTCKINYSVEKSPLFKLRQKTGLAYSLCREALDKHDNDVVEAESWLNAQALTYGLQKATRVRVRSAREGLIGLAIQHNNKMATILELNCETDFVARNQIFKDFAINLTEQVASMQNSTSHPFLDQNFVEELKPSKEHLESFDSQIAPLITKFGENIKVNRVSQFQATEESTYMFGQIHAESGQKNTNDLDIVTGRFGAIVALRNMSQNSKLNDSLLKIIGNRLCQHVIGYNPTYIELPCNIRKHLEAIEKERLSIQAEGENDHSESEELHMIQNNRDEWPSIMDQLLIMSEETTVRNLCKENETAIVYFNRFECGS